MGCSKCSCSSFCWNPASFIRKLRCELDHNHNDSCYKREALRNCTCGHHYNYHWIERFRTDKSLSEAVSSFATTTDTDATSTSESTSASTSASTSTSGSPMCYTENCHRWNGWWTWPTRSVGTARATRSTYIARTSTSSAPDLRFV